MVRETIYGKRATINQIVATAGEGADVYISDYTPELKLRRMSKGLCNEKSVY
jgi:hypothetical protein